MEKAHHFFKRNLFPLLLVLVTGFLCWRNFTPGTWLSGWDTLHPEFNFPLNLKRAIFGVWREEQGLGTVAGHSHMADLPRILFLWLLSFIFPFNNLRYLYIFLCLILGPLGVYWYGKYLFLASPRKNPSGLESSTRRVGELAKLSSFLGGLFYLLNLGTLQHFYVPFEMFPTLYAALPWLFLSATKFIQKRKRKDLVMFSLITFLSTPMAYAAHLWYVYFLCLFLYLITLSFLNRKFKPAIILLLLTLIINSYWLLPNLYFLVNHSKDVPLAKTNRLFSEEAFLASKEFGTIKDVAILKNFLFNWSEYVGNGKFDYLLNEWRNHLANPKIEAIGYVAFNLVILGILTSLVKKEKYALALLPIFFACFLFILDIYTPIGGLLLKANINLSIVKEGFRFPFTKFSLPLMFTYAVFLSQGTNLLLMTIKKITKKPIFCYLSLFTLSFSLIFFMLPVFKGNLISPSMRIKIPQEYFALFDWFNQQEEQGKVAHFPIHTPYGWSYYDWGNSSTSQDAFGNLRGFFSSFQGAGFMWFGIKQPVLDRDFDRWNPVNEQFYREASYALYSQDVSLLEKVLEKYQVRWILVDENIIAPENRESNKFLYFQQMKDLFAFSDKITLAKRFGPQLSVYQNSLNVTYNDEFIVDNYVRVEPTYLWSYQDQAYWENGNYISGEGIYYPFRTFLDKQEKMPDDLLVITDESYLITLDQFPDEPIIIPHSTAVDLDILSLERRATSCNHRQPKHIERNRVRQDRIGYIEYISQRGSICDHFDFPELFQNQGYLLVVETKNVAGLPLRLCLSNYKTKKCDLYTSLSKSKDFLKHFYVIPPMGDYGAGFDLNIDNYAVGNTQSINHLKSIKIYSFPYTWLKEMKFVNSQKANNQKPNLLIFNQAFEKGWQAYQIKDKKSKIKNWLNSTFPMISGEKIPNHVLVNNWANGWLIDKPKIKNEKLKIYIVFIPQLLECLGFALWVTIPLILTRKVKIPKPFGFKTTQN